MLVRAESLSKSMSHYLVERIQQIPNIVVEPHTEVMEVHGDERLSAISIRHHDTGEVERRDAGAMFIFIGAEPHTEWLEGTLRRDGKGFLLTGQSLMTDGKRPAGWTLPRDPYLLETNIAGVFAVGDVRDGAVRRVANSVGEGSIVLYFIRQYMANR
jgi:thioredoxin reductase (NADPH)